MWEDEIIEEIHRIRAAYAKTFGYDLNAMFNDLRRKQEESGMQVVTLSRDPDSRGRWSGQRKEVEGETADMNCPPGPAN